MLVPVGCYSRPLHDGAAFLEQKKSTYGGTAWIATNANEHETPRPEIPEDCESLPEKLLLCLERLVDLVNACCV